MLSDWQIRAAVQQGAVGIEVFQEDRLQPASYDVELGRELLRLTPGLPIDPKVDSRSVWEPATILPQGYLLSPGEFVLATTEERFDMGGEHLGKLEGKSSLGRLGLEVHATAGFIDPGFVGQVTLELSCTQRRGIYLYAGMPIGQVAFTRVAKVERTYTGKYLAQTGPTASRYHQNWNGWGWV